MYLTVIINLFNRKVVGWSMSDSLTTESTIIPEWNMAVKSNTISEELIFHSDVVIDKQKANKKVIFFILISKVIIMTFFLYFSSI